MGKLCADAVLDTMLQYLEDNVDFLSVCEGAPTTYEHAHSNKGTATGKVLASSATPTFTGPAADGVDGRKTSVDEEASMTVDVSGAADHVALCKTGTTVLLYVTTCTEQVLTAANTVTAPTWDIKVGYPT